MPEKRFAYLQLESLKHNLLIDPESWTVEHVERRNGEWFSSVLDFAPTLILASPAIELPVADRFVGL